MTLSDKQINYLFSMAGAVGIIFSVTSLVRFVILGGVANFEQTEQSGTQPDPEAGAYQISPDNILFPNSFSPEAGMGLSGLLMIAGLVLMVAALGKNTKSNSNGIHPVVGSFSCLLFLIATVTIFASPSLDAGRIVVGTVTAFSAALAASLAYFSREKPVPNQSETAKLMA